MKRFSIVALTWLSLCGGLQAQLSGDPPEATVNHATLVGVGKAFLSDSYLSPLTYDGMSISLLHDRIKASPLAGGKLSWQQQFQIQTAITKNPTASASEYYGDIRYHLTGFYPLLKMDRLTLLGGGGAALSLGGIYNVRNSNNPGSLKSALNLQLSAMALYHWKDITFRWQLTSPFAGMFFSPEYGHSYYEIFTLGNNKGTIHFGSFHNQLALKNYFTIDFPIRNITLRAGYLGDFYQTGVNQLHTRIVSHQFMAGLAFESIHFGGRRVRGNPAIRSSYY
jgi:hypothetical protein